MAYARKIAQAYIISASILFTSNSFAQEPTLEDELTVNYISYMFGQTHQDLFSASSSPSKFYSGIKHIFIHDTSISGLSDIFGKAFNGLNPLDPDSIGNPKAMATKFILLFLLGMPAESSYKEQEIKASHFGKYYFSEDADNPKQAKLRMFDQLEAISSINFPYTFTEKLIEHTDEQDQVSYVFIHDQTEYKAQLSLGNVHYSSGQPERDSMLGFVSYFESQSDTSLTFRVFKVETHNGRKFEYLVPLKELNKFNDINRYLKSLTSIKGVFLGSNDLKTFHHNNKTFTRDDLKKISKEMLQKKSL